MVQAAALQPAPLPGGEAGAGWNGTQFVAADRSGRVYFFRSETFEVYPVTPAGSFGKPLKLETGLVPQSSDVASAVMSPGGSLWIVKEGKALRLFENGKERPLPPLQWPAQSIGFRRDTPIVAVLPLPLGTTAEQARKMGNPPRLIQLDKDRWSTFVESKAGTMAEILDREPGGLNDSIAEASVAMTSDRQGRLWLAPRYAYRLERLGPAGRLLTTLQVDGGKVRKTGDSRGIEIQRKPTQNPTSATRSPAQEKSSFFPFTAEAVLHGIAEGRDGRLYLLVREAGGGLAIDRYDGGQSLLERVPLTARFDGSLTLAAGQDGLYLAAHQARGGRWRISWEALEQAAWKKVDFEGGEPSPSS
jgi:hypothetical protein